MTGIDILCLEINTERHAALAAVIAAAERMLGVNGA